MKSKRWLKPWGALCWGLTLLPFNATLGVIPLFFVLVSTWWGGFRQILQQPGRWGWLLLSLWLLLTTGLAENKAAALLGLAHFLPYFAVLTAFRQVIRRFQQLQQLAWWLTLAVVVLVGLGLGQLYGQWQSPAWLTTIGTDLIAGGWPEGRMSSVLMYANLFSAWLLLVFPLSIGLLIQSWRDWQRSPQPSTLRKLKLYFLAMAVVVEAIALGLSHSRSAWGIALLIGVAYAVYLGWYFLVAMVGAASTVVLWASFGPFAKQPLRRIVPRYLWARLSDELYPDRYRTALRSTQWQFSWDMFMDRPLTGWGLRNFTPLYQAAMDVWIGHPHSLLLMLLAETGLIGTLMLLGLVGWILARALRLFWWLAQQPRSPRRQRQQLLFFSYGVGFSALCVYNLFDVTLFDLRNNLFAWSYLAAIAGVTDQYLPRLSH